MLRFWDRARSGNSSRVALLPMWPSASVDGVGTPIVLISRLNGPAYAYPCQRFALALTDADA